MIALPKHKMTVDEFLAWAEVLPKEAGRFELWDGEVIVKRGPAGSEMNSERSQHWHAKEAIFLALREGVSRSGVAAQVAGEGPTVRFSSERAAEPDALVYMGERVPRGVLEVANPVIVVEVLSPSTQNLDLNWKLQAYFTLPSIEHYLVVDPEKPLVIHHKRGSDGAIETRIVTTSALRLDPPGIDVDLTEVLGI